ncbi:invasin domain 3-containing protein [Aquirufa nivalisilvae]
MSGVANLSSLGLKYTGAVGSGTFTFTPASGTAVTSGSITINPGSANKFVITGSGTQTAGTSQTITITAKDANGNTVSSYSGSKDLTFSGANSSASPATAPKVGSTDFGTATSVSFTNGVATASMSLYKVESASISVTDGSLTSSGGGELSVSVSVGTFAKFSLALAGPQTSGTAFSGTNSLTAQDAYGNVVTGFDASTNNVTVSSSLTGSITGLSGTNKLNSASDFVSGVANLTSLGLKYTGESGSGTFTFTPATGAPVSSSSLTINSGTATKLIITGTGTQTAGTSQTITITAKDASGNTATAYTGVKSITFSGASASSSPVTNPTVGGTNVGTATNVTFSNGVATASLSLYHVESAVLAATDGSLSAAGSDRLSVSVSAGSFSKLIVSLTSPQTSGTAFSGTNSLTAQDAYGNVVTGFDASTNNITVSTSLTGSISGLSGTNKLNNAGDFVSGVANISSLTFTGTSGTGTFTFTPASGTAVTSANVVIMAGSATKFIVTGTGTQTAGGSQNITITAKDASGNTATAYTGAKSITFSGANASSSPATNPTVASIDFGTATSVSFSNGVATVSMSLYKVESALIVATDGSVTTSGSDRLSVSVSPAVFSKLALSLAGPQINGVGFTGTNSLTALDAYGNVVTGFDASGNNITVSTSLSGSISGLSGTNKLNSASDFVSGVANLSSLGLKYTGAVGSGTFTFTPASGTAVTSGSITINPGSANRLVITGTGTQTAGSAQTITITAKDASGNTITSYTGDKSLTFSGANSSLSPVTTPKVTDKNSNQISLGTAATITFTNGVATTNLALYLAEAVNIVVSDGTLTASGADRLAITVGVGSFSKFGLTLAASQSSGTAFSGTNTLTALDAYGNVVTGFDASANNVTVSSSLTGSISGLSGTNKLTSASDFVNGVANLSSLGLTFTGTSGTGTFTFTPATGLAVTSSNVSVSSGSATRLIITGASTQTAGVAQTITITAKDANGNIVTSFTGDKTLVFSGASLSPNGNFTASATNKTAVATNFGSNAVVTFNNGVASSSLVLYAAETANVAASTAGITASSGSDRLAVTVSTGTFSQLAVSLAASQSNAIAWTGTNTLTAKDAYGNIVTTFNAASNVITVSSSLTGNITGLSGINKLNAAGDFVNGVANLSSLGIVYSGLAGSVNFTFTPTSGSASSGGPVTINPGALNKLIVTGSATQIAGTAQTITLTAKDSGGNTITSYTGTKSLTFSGAAASSLPVTNPTVGSTAFGSATSVVFTNGVATASMNLYHVENAVIAVSDGTISSTGTDRLAVTVNPAVFNKLQVTLASTQANGVAFTGTNTLTAMDAYGNVETSFDASANNISVTTSLTGSISGLSGTNKLTNVGDFVNGVANLTSLGLKFTGTSGTGTLTFTPATGTAVTSTNVTFTSGSVSKFIVTGAANQVAGVAQTITITAKDASGNTVTSYTGAKLLTFSGANPSTSPVTKAKVAGVDVETETTITFSNGVATASMILYQVESANVAVTDGSALAEGTDRLTVAVTAGSFSKFALALVSPQNSSETFKGINTLTAQDAYGNTVTGFSAATNNVTVSTSLSGVISGLSGTNKLNAAGDFVNGVANLTSLGMIYSGSPGTGTFTFTPSTGTAITSGNIIINGGDATKLVITSAASTVAAGVAQSIIITAKDTNGNTSTIYTGTKSLVFSGANSSASPATSPIATSIAFGTATPVTFVNGVATLNVTLFKAETALIAATDGTISSAGADRLSLSVTPSTFSKLAVSLASPQNSAVAFTGTNTLTAQDAFGNTVTGFSAATNNVTVSTSLSGVISGLSGTNKLNAAGDFVNGVANLTSLGMIYSGSPGTGTFTFTPSTGTAITSGNIIINGGDATKLVITSAASTVAAGAAQSIIITAKDTNGNTSTIYTGTKSLIFSGANSSASPATSPIATSIAFGTATPVTFVNGVATLNVTLFKAETALIAATDGTISSAGADRLSLSVTPSTFSKLAVSLASPQNSAVAFTGTNTLTAQDAYGNTVTGFSAATNNITVTTSLAGTISGLSGTNKLTSATDFVAGVSSLTGLTYAGVTGTGTFTFTPASGTATTSTSIVINTNVASAATSTLTPISASLVASGVSQTLTVTAKDALGNAITTGGATVVITKLSGVGTVSAVTDNANGTYTATVSSLIAGTGVFVATINANPVLSGTASQTQASITFTVGAVNATVSTLTPTTANIFADGSTQTLTVTAKDLNGNAITTGGATVLITKSSGVGTVSAVTDNGNGTYTATVSSNTPGTGVFVASINGNPVLSGNSSQTTASITFNTGAATKLIITGSGTQTAGGQQIITITAKDASGNTALGYTGSKLVTFSGATSSASPVTAPSIDGTNMGTATSLNFSQGVATAVMRLYKAETATITASEGTIATIGTDRLTVAVSTATMSKFELNLSSPQVAGQAFVGVNTLTAQDAFGNIITNFNASSNNVTVSTNSLGTISGLSGTNKLNAATDFVNGVANLTSLGLIYTGETGAVTFTFTASTGATVTSPSITLSSGEAAKIKLSTIANHVAGLPQTITATLVDVTNNPVKATANGVITLTVKTGTGTLTGTVSATLLAGSSSVEISGWSYTKSETGVVLLATGSGLTSNNVTGKTGESNAFNVTAGAPANFIIKSNNNTVRAGLKLTIDIFAVDQYQNTITDFKQDLLMAFAGASISPNRNAMPQIGLSQTSTASIPSDSKPQSRVESSKKTTNSTVNILSSATGGASLANAKTGTGSANLVLDGFTPFGSDVMVKFVNGVATLELVLFAAEVANLDARTVNGSIVTKPENKLPITVVPDKFNTLEVKLDPVQESGKPITGSMTAVDEWGNVVKTFNAAENPVKIVVTSVSGTTSTSQSTYVLSKPTDFSQGVADFSVLGITYKEATSGSSKFTITPTEGAAVQTPEIVVVSPDTDGDSVTDEQELIDKTDVNDGCSYLMSSFVLSKTSASWKAMDCDGDGSPNGTDVEPSNACSGGVAGYIPPRGSVGYAKYFAGDCDSDGISNEMECNGGYLGTGSCQDFDSDGIPNFLDPDSDNDGILDMIEKNIDSDGDGHANYLDLDSDNDGILDSQERSYDTDGDGVMNFLDIDSDNDGILDAWEGTDNKRGTIDDNYDGRVDKNGSRPDVNGNGLADFLEGNPAPVPDTDKDGTPDYIDLDSDGDGIADKIELTNDPDKDGKPNYRDKDSDGDWLGDSDERDTDNDGDRIPNYLDADSDGDGIPDAWEGKDKCRECDNSNDDNDNGWDDRGEYKAVIDSDKDGSPDFLDLDSDNDCIPDGVEGGADWDQDKLANFRDTDSDGDGILDIVEVGDCNKPWDTDGDGLKNFEDTDSDGDGIPDNIEAGKDLSKPVDTDGDGIPDMLDLDSDNDTIPDKVEVGSDVWKPLDTDKDGKDDFRDTDSDNDTVADRMEVGPNPNMPRDSDKDGLPDYRDTDSDNDTMPDGVEVGIINGVPVDTDKDGLADMIDTDSDNDGIPDSIEAGMVPLVPLDSDGDLLPDYRDTDSDNDGILDSIEVGPDVNNPLNTDGDFLKDGSPKYDYRDTDSDNDGIPDFIEAGANPLKPQDSDGDNLPDYRELDSDNDGIPDSVEAGKDPMIPVDSDKDGKADYTDTDSDNDTISDRIEAGDNPKVPVDTDKDGLPDYLDLDTDGDTIPDKVEVGPDPTKPLDTDKDGIYDFRDLDSDGDGIPDKIEAGKNPNIPDDTDGDGLPDYRDIDSDNNGISDKEEVGPDPLHPIDTDGDGIPDYKDPDDDGDGIPDKLEDDLNYGALPDCDHDGIPNSKDKDICEPFVTQGFSPNGDGVNDKFVIPGIMSMPNHHLTIFNRWGNIVYEIDNYKNDWGGEIPKGVGIVQGEGTITDGVYFYIIDFKGAKPNIQSFIYVNRLDK